MASSDPILHCPACGTRNRVPAAASGTPRCGRCKASLPWLADADDSTFGEIADKSPVPAIVDLWAPWCGPCRTVSPMLEQLAGEFAGRCKVVKVNVDETPSTSARFGVRGIPTLVAMRGGAELDRKVGAAPLQHLREWFSHVVAT